MALIILVPTFAATGKPVPVKASEVYIQIDNSGKKISLLDLSQITLVDFKALTGQDMKRADKAMFKMAQKKLRKSISPDGTLKNEKLNTFFTKKVDGTTGFHIGGFALGFYLSTTGVLIAYLINDAKKKNRVKWAWIGLGAQLALVLLLVAATVSLHR